MTLTTTILPLNIPPVPIPVKDPRVASQPVLVVKPALSAPVAADYQATPSIPAVPMQREVEVMTHDARRRAVAVTGISDYKRLLPALGTMAHEEIDRQNDRIFRSLAGTGLRAYIPGDAESPDELEQAVRRAIVRVAQERGI